MIPRHIAEVTALLSTAYPSWKMNEKTVAVYATLLGDIEPNALKAAAAQFCRTSEFPPTVAALVRLAREHQGCGDNSPTPSDAWAEVFGHIRNSGYMERPKWSHPRITRALRVLGGWVDVCSAPPAHLPSNRSRFLEAYAAAEKDDGKRREIQETRDLLQLPRGVSAVGIAKELPE